MNSSRFAIRPNAGAYKNRDPNFEWPAPEDEKKRVSKSENDCGIRAENDLDKATQGSTCYSLVPALPRKEYHHQLYPDQLTSVDF